MTRHDKYTYEEMEPQYNLRARRPDYDVKVVPDWIRRSEEYRAANPCQLDLAYGSGAREKLDFFPAAGQNSPILAYFHGGYWQRGDKSVYSFLAAPFVKNGVSVAMINYDLCPSVRISQISIQARAALAWLWRNAAGLGGSPDQLYVMGHSAGGHITGMMMATDWPALGADLPRDMLKGGIPVSGLFDLQPLRFSSINDGVRMDEAEATAESPMNHAPATDAPQLVVCGGAETEEFHRQSDIYVAAFTTPARRIERYSVPDCDHFDELNALAREDSAFFEKSLRLITG
ncbi:MAG: alpha/beta hydrolase [Burkholderiaceae bacterium]